jgi:hypothetical protein
MHAYCILLPSETDDSRFNSREKHMLTDSVQPYNKPIIDLACSVCTVKYQTFVFLHENSYWKTSVWYFTVYRPHARSISRYYNLSFSITYWFAIAEKWLRAGKEHKTFLEDQSKVAPLAFLEVISTLKCPTTSVFVMAYGFSHSHFCVCHSQSKNRQIHSYFTPSRPSDKTRRAL